jgi:hypothetical protein
VVVDANDYLKSFAVRPGPWEIKSVQLKHTDDLFNFNVK